MGKSTLVQIMAWCHQAPSHYLNQCWPSSMAPGGHYWNYYFDFLSFKLSHFNSFEEPASVDFIMFDIVPCSRYRIHEWYVKVFIQCKRDIPRLVGSKQWCCDISESATYRATVMSPNQAPFTSALWAIMGLFHVLAVNSACRQRISYHLSKVDVAVQTAL